jgi:hypothetical protein
MQPIRNQDCAIDDDENPNILPCLLKLLQDFRGNG